MSLDPSQTSGDKTTLHPARFIKVVADFFESWLKVAAFRIAIGQIRIAGTPHSYPTVLRVGESPSHYIAELMGSSDADTFCTLGLRRPKRFENHSSTTSFFNPGLDTDAKQTAIIRISNRKHIVTNLTLCTEYDEMVFSKKVNFPVSMIRFAPPTGANTKLPLAILPSSDRLIFRNIDLIRTDTFRVLFRTISTAIVVKKTIRESDLTEWLRQAAQEQLNFDVQPDILGLNLRFHAYRESFARQLASLSDQSVTEPIIDEFIQTHAEQFAEALGYKRALSQKTLQWVDREPDDPEESIPDFLMERPDGYCDILDLKKAVLKYKSVTVGKKARIRFNSYVSELVAQLKGYERYFKKDANRQWAVDRYGVRVKNPRLIGVVGNHDNFIRDDVDLALEQYKDNIVVFSYKDVIDLLRKRPSVANA